MYRLNVTNSRMEFTWTGSGKPVKKPPKNEFTSGHALFGKKERKQEIQHETQEEKKEKAVIGRV